MPLESPNILLTFGAFLLLLGTLVIVHELGHYFVGRWFGVKAEKFSIGFGPQIWGRVDKRGTLWRVAALPLGGYVQFAGDLNPSSQSDEAWKDLPEPERSQTFPSKPLWQRALIIFAGPAVNFLFAILVFTGFGLAFGERVSPPVVEAVVAGGPAEKAGIVAGDRIVSFGGRQIDRFEDLIDEAIMVPNELVQIIIERDGGKIEKNVMLKERIEKDRFGNVYKLGQLGVRSGQMVFRDVGILESPLVGARATLNVLRQQIKGLGQIISGRRSVTELGGPLKIAKVSGEAMSMGILAFVTLAALVSINLGFINLLPIPMLDGGHLLLYAIEAVRRRPATPQVQEWAFRAGFVMLIGFMLMVTFNDLSSFGVFGR